jgi:hypothetical protein
MAVGLLQRFYRDSRETFYRQVPATMGIRSVCPTWTVFPERLFADLMAVTLTL